MAISDVVNVQITIQDASPTEQNFGTPLMVASAPVLITTPRTYPLTFDGATAMLNDGFDLTSEAYLRVSQMIKQTPSTTEIIIYPRVNAGNAYSYTINTVVDATNYDLVVVFGGTSTPVTFTSGAGATLQQVVDGVIGVLTGVAGVTAVQDGTVTAQINITNSGANDPLTMVVTNPNVVNSTLAGVASIVPDLNAALADSSIDFYGLMIDSDLDADNLAAAAIAEGAQRLFAITSVDPAVWSASTTDVLSLLQAQNLTYTFLLATRDTAGKTSACLLGRQLSQTPGSTNWSYQRLTGPVADGWTATELAAITGKGGMVFMTTNGVDHTYGLGGLGSAVGGRDISITRGKDKLQATIESNVLTVFVNNEKVPFTNAGILQIENALRAALLESVAEGLISDDFTVVSPLASAVSAADRANGLLADMSFQANLLGAIGKVSPLNGTLSF